MADTYDNPRMLVNNQLKILFGLQFLETENSSGLKNIRRGVNSCLLALRTFKVSTSDWDPFIVFMCVQRLPRPVVSLWEQTIKDKCALFTWGELDEFLLNRIQTLECLDDLKGQSNHALPDRRVKAHVTKSGNSGVMRTTVKAGCAFCSKPGHFLRVCSRFRKLSVTERLGVVQQLHVCSNCLSPSHELGDYHSALNCSLCNQRHNTLLHRDTCRAEMPSSTSLEARAPPAMGRSVGRKTDDHTGGNGSAVINRQVYHVSQQGTIILGTAIVNIVHQGTYYMARALIDPASEASFITESLRNVLKLMVFPIEARISGVDQAITGMCHKCCPLRISSPLDASVNLETDAYVLSRISGKIPSFDPP